MSEFKTFSKRVNERFAAIRGEDLFTVDVGDLFETYLASFPAGTNPLFRARTEHDCSCCKTFIRRIGHVVAIVDGKVLTVWDGMDDLPHPYGVVASALAEKVRSATITGVFKTKETRFGAESTKELSDDGKVINWNHFHCEMANSATKHVTQDVGEKVGESKTAFAVLKRALDDFTAESLNTVSELISEKAIYRGEEHKGAVSAFSKLHRDYHALLTDRDRDLLIWSQVHNRQLVNFKNSAIGSLVEDLSYGEDTEKAVKSFESKVAPQNYKRPTSLVTQRMVNDAIAKIRELGLEDSIPRRHAKLSDIPVTDVLFVDNSVRGSMAGGFLEEIMADAAQQPTAEIRNPTPISIEDFVRDVLPNAKKVNLLLEGSHLGNFVSMTAPVNPTAPLLFKWSNGFAWSYDGDVADSMRQRVQSRGGRVDGVLRFTHQWNDVGRNASLMDLHVFMPGHEFTKSPKSDSMVNDSYGGTQRVGWNNRKHTSSGGVQDVDYVNPAPEGYIPVENITFPDVKRMPEGDYVMRIHNWQLRSPTDSGFKAEIEFEGKIFQYDHPAPLRHKEWITLAIVTLKDGKFSIRHTHPVGAASQEKWGVKTETLVPVEIISNSPNHWRGESVGNRHWFFTLKGCLNPDPVRGIYNEFLRPEVNEHRKVLEIMGARTKAPYSPDQVSGVGFSSGRGDSVKVSVTGAGFNRSYQINF